MFNFKSLSDAAVTKVVVNVVVRAATYVVPKILDTDTIFGFALIYSF